MQKLISKIKYLLVLVVLMTGGMAAKAQHAAEFNVGYQVNIPLGEFRNYVTNPGVKGFSAGFAIPVNDQLRIGLNVAYNDYYQKYPRQVYPQGDHSSVSAVLSNSIQQTPITINATYNLLKKGIIIPFVGVGGGVVFNSFDQYLGEFDNPISKVNWVAQGEAGIWIPLSKYAPTAIKIAGVYNYAAFNDDGIGHLNSVGIQAGIRFGLH